MAVNVLHMTPEAIWRATPRELAMALKPFAARGTPPTRGRLDELMKRFPDRRGPDV